MTRPTNAPGHLQKSPIYDRCPVAVARRDQFVGDALGCSGNVGGTVGRLRYGLELPERHQHAGRDARLSEIHRVAHLPSLPCWLPVMEVVLRSAYIRGRY